MKKKLYYFVTHKVMATVIAILTLLVGIIALLSLPIEQYPDIAPPTIYVTTTYTGADANSAMNSVVIPLEESINGVEHMTHITSSTSSNGEVTIQVFFEQGTDPDMATVNVQNRVSKALGLLPSEVTQVGVQVFKRQNSTLQMGALVSTDGRFDQDFISNYLDVNVVPAIKRINGVGDVNNFGNVYSLRIWMKPDAMAQYNLVPNDIFNAIGSQNLVAPAGSLGENSGNTYLYTLEYRGRLNTIEEFNNIVIKADNGGKELLLSDVATVELGAISYSFMSNVDGKPAAIFMVSQVAGANATDVNAQIGDFYKQMEKSLPPGLEFIQLQTADDFLFAAIGNVVETLIIAILLVILVVFFFLQDFRATIIPSVSIIVSLVGTFAVVKLAGFSLNILTLFALVLAIGTVVDDAIVVTEAVMSKLETGYTNVKLATSDAIHEVFSAVISCTLVFMAVFIPVSFMPGTSGTFFTQFGITLATSVGISCISALSLCPAMCAIMLRPKTEEDGKKGFSYYVKNAYDASYSAISGKYFKSVDRFLNKKALSWIGLIIASGIMVWLMSTTPSELVPQEDQGVVMMNITAPPGYTLQQTDELLDRVEKEVMKNEEVEHCGRIAGYGLISGSGYNNATMIVRLKSWDERKGMKHSINAIIGKIYLSCQGIKEAQIMAFQQPQIPGYGQGNAIELILQNRDGSNEDAFSENVNKFTAALAQRPEIGMAFKDYEATFPKYSVDVDATLCARAGVSKQEVLSVLGSYCGGAYISNYNQFGKIYRVLAQASPEFRLDPSSLNNIFVRVQSGEMAPISQFVTLTPKVGTAVNKRFNLYSSITLNVSPAAGFSSGQAMQAIQEVFDQTMPQGTGYEYSGMSREEAKNAGSNMTSLIYALCIFLIYLILACLYDSWFIPLSVLLSVPFGLMGAYLFIRPLCPYGFTSNIYLQTGVIMLIGLQAKTAILITEFALAKRKAGIDIRTAAFEACKDRLRPILMTVLCMIIGMLPLIIKSGAGAMGNRSLSLGVVGGMTIGTIALVFVTPAFYIAFQKLHERFQGSVQENEKENNEEPESHIAIE